MEELKVGMRVYLFPDTDLIKIVGGLERLPLGEIVEIDEINVRIDLSSANGMNLDPVVPVRIQREQITKAEKNDDESYTVYVKVKSTG